MSGLFDVSKEIILVTGASQGLGRQFARVLSAHGALHDRRVVTVDGGFLLT
jgi:NAD(P)-dependent dehydrogenase (short-subunit alcohol dehydrogenase family)